MSVAANFQTFGNLTPEREKEGKANMVNVILALAALVVVELGVLIGVVIWRSLAGERPSGSAVVPPSAEPTSEEEKQAKIEKRIQDSMAQMMGYDLAAARRAVRRDADESDE